MAVTSVTEPVGNPRSSSHDGSSEGNTDAQLFASCLAPSQTNPPMSTKTTRTAAARTYRYRADTSSAASTRSSVKPTSTIRPSMP